VLQLDVDVSLDVDTSLYEERGYTTENDFPENTVEVGVVSVAAADIAGELIARGQVSDPDDAAAQPPSTGIPLRAIGISLRATKLWAIKLRATKLRATDLADGSILGAVTLDQLATRFVGSTLVDHVNRPVVMPKIPLSDIPLIPDGWTAFLHGSDFQGLPLQSVHLEDLAGDTDLLNGLRDLDLGDLDLSASALGSLSLPAVALSGWTLEDLLPDRENLCAAFNEIERSGKDDSVSDFFKCPASIKHAQLWELQLLGADVDHPEIVGLPLTALVDQTNTLKSIKLRATKLRATELQNTVLSAIKLWAIKLRATKLWATDICTGGLDGTWCSDDPTVNTWTLGDVLAACETINPDLPCLLNPDADLGDLLDALAAEGLLDGLDLIDLLLAFLQAEDAGWEAIDLEGAYLQNIGVPPQPAFHYVATIEVEDGPADNVDVTFTLPTGFAVALDSDATFCHSTELQCETAPLFDRALVNTPEYRLTNVATGTWVLRVPVRAGLVVGADNPALVNVTYRQGERIGQAFAPKPPDEVLVNVVGFGANRGAQPTPEFISRDQVRLGHLASDGGVDLYELESTRGGSASILLSNLGADFDLSVYSTRDDALKDPSGSLRLLRDTAYDLDPSTAVLETDLANDLILDAPSRFDLGEDVRGVVLRDASARRGTNDEEVVIPALEAGQKYYVAVSSYLGSSSPKPYALRVRIDDRSSLPTECVAAPIPAPVPDVLAGKVANLPINEDTKVLYVTNLGALLGGHTDSSAMVGQILDQLELSAAAFQAGVLNLQGLSGWDDAYCDVGARNDLVRKIAADIDKVLAVRPNIEHIVILGDDSVVPMAAVPDLTTYSNEATFALEVLSADSTTGAAKSNPLAAALGNGYLLSDNPYASSAGISVLNGDHELYVPDRSIGRLVETPEEIWGQLNNFNESNGVLDVSTLNAAVTGYDFLTDGADAVIDALDGFTVSKLNDDEWNKFDLIEILDGDGAADSPRPYYDVISLNAHYDYQSLLPAEQDTKGYFTTSQLFSTTDIRDDLMSAVIFTMGCHAGLSVSDVQVGFGALDWAQKYAQTDNRFIGHTTYGYGDSEAVAYSERLAQIFARYVADMAAGAAGAPASLGEALQRTRQDYLDTTLVLTPYDEKLLHSFTYYGLPMYGLVNAPASSTTFTPPANFATSTIAADLPIQSGRAILDAAGDGSVDVSIDLSGDAITKTVAGYYEVDGNTIVAPYRPVQPLVDVPLSVLGDVDGFVLPPGGYQGFVITGMTSEDTQEAPVFSRPLKDSSESEGPVESFDGSFPSTLQRIAGEPGQQRLLVAAGQYQGRSAADGQEPTQRLFTKISGRLLPYAGDDEARDDEPPRLIEIEGRRVQSVGGGQSQAVEFEVVAEDAETDVAEVVVLFRQGDETVWRSLSLEGPVAGRWSGAAPISDEDKDVEFIVQAVDASGNVGLSNNKIKNFAAERASNETQLRIEAKPPADFTASEPYYPSLTTFKVLLEGPSGDTEATGAFFYVNSVLQPYPAGGIIVEQVASASDEGYNPGTRTWFLRQGAHVLTVEDANGNRQYRFFVLDGSGPAVTIDAPATSGGEFSVTITADDFGGSGVASITCRLGDGTECPIPTPHGETLTYQFDVQSTTEIVAFATDNVGNRGEEQSATVVVDRKPPVVTIELRSDPTGPLDSRAWWNTGVYVTVKADDGDGTGVTSISYRTCRVVVDTEDVCSDFVTSAGLDPVNFTIPVTSDGAADGTIRVDATATDASGNLGSANRAVQIDATMPSASVVIKDADGNPKSSFAPNEAAYAHFECSDALSGIESCKLNGNLVSSPILLNTSTPGSYTVTVEAIDKAGNRQTNQAGYSVGYLLCDPLLYDATQAKTIGSNYTIKLRLCDANNRNVSSKDLRLTALRVTALDTNIDYDPGPNYSGNSNNGYEFRYEAKDRSYVYNLKTDFFPAGNLLLKFTTVHPVDRTDPTVVATNAAPFILR
jgi:hypothetical protein